MITDEIKSRRANLNLKYNDKYIKEKRKDYNRQYYLKHKTKIKKKSRAYNLKHRKEIKEYKKKYYLKNKEGNK